MATISHCIISANTSEQHGGGLYGCNGLISNCTITGNRTGSGGGLCRCNGWIRNCIISDNKAHSGGGLSECYGRITNCFITDNRTEAGGGGLMWCVEISECTISGNIGSGVLMCSSISKCVITGNTGYLGGGVSGSGSVNNCIIMGNTAYSGGGISACSSISNCTIAGNKAKFGGGIFCTNISSKITNSTISNNTAKADGGGIYCWGIDAAVSNCIMWGDTAPQGNEIALFSYCVCCVTGCICYPSLITVTYCDAEGGPTKVYTDSDCTLDWKTGNIDVDPCFTDVGYWDPNENPTDPNDDFWIEGDYHLLAASPCIDAGGPNYAAEPNETDLDGKPRVIGGRIDMGAYEYRLPISAEVRIVPRTINLQSKGEWITGFIQIPEDYVMNDIDANSVYLEGEIKPERFWLAEDNQIAIARFSREEVQAFLTVGEVELTITGQLTDGTIFEGKDTIKVTDKGNRKD
jgi:predicted outer membrane repeat protein